MRIDIDNLHEIGDLAERFDKARVGALILIGGVCMILLLALAVLWMAKH
jgi:hypothetical protein